MKTISDIVQILNVLAILISLNIVLGKPTEVQLKLDNSLNNSRPHPDLFLVSTIITPRIIGGSSAYEGQFPWHVLIRRFEIDKVWCGGSIISNQWILTAAHCVDGFKSLIVVVGIINLKTKNPKSYKSNVLIIHPQFNTDNYNNDVALIKLPEPLQFNKQVNKVNLVSRAKANDAFVGFNTFVTGFGYTSDVIPDYSNKLLYTNLIVITNQECIDTYGDDVIQSSTICGKGEAGTIRGICGGDSGGAMVVEENGQFYQIGISSFVADDVCEDGFPSGFARVGPYLDFISEQTGIIIN